MNTHVRKLVPALLIAGCLAEAAGALPEARAEAPAVRSPAQRQKSSAARVTRASHETYDPAEAMPGTFECPPEGRPLSGCRCRYDIRPQICANWYAHWNHLGYRLDAMKWRPHVYYHMTPGYADPRDAQVYSAEGYGVPVSSPVAPVTGYMWNYNWNVPAARLTPLGGGSRDGAGAACDPAAGQ